VKLSANASPMQRPQFNGPKAQSKSKATSSSFSLPAASVVVANGRKR
jgi:hypothetical protein